MTTPTKLFVTQRLRWDEDENGENITLVGGQFATKAEAELDARRATDRNGSVQGIYQLVSMTNQGPPAATVADVNVGNTVPSTPVA